jgi:hypothetical protein
MDQWFGSPSSLHLEDEALVDAFFCESAGQMVCHISAK